MGEFIKVCTSKVRYIKKKVRLKDKTKTYRYLVVYLKKVGELASWLEGDEVEIYINDEDKSKVLLVNIDYLARRKLFKKV